MKFIIRIWFCSVWRFIILDMKPCIDLRDVRPSCSLPSHLLNFHELSGIYGWSDPQVAVPPQDGYVP